MTILVYSLVTAALMLAGGLWVATRPQAWLTEGRLSLLVAAGTGLLLATLGLEMLPSASEALGHRAFVWFLAGIGIVLLLEHHAAPWLDRLLAPPRSSCQHDHSVSHEAHAADCDAHAHAHHHHVAGSAAALSTTLAHSHGHHAHGLLSHGTACTAVGCLIVCTFFDGLSLAAGFSTSAQLGALLGAGLLLHLLPEGVVAASVLLAAGASRAAARRAATVVACALLGGVLVASGLGGALGGSATVLALASGVIAYVVLGQLVPVALRAPGGLWLMLGVTAALALFEHLWPHSHA
ncbi:MAG: ZIP family metal transporter [Candidatus Sericytochromatia bacterium]|nr:ZIP family metal transporter [Candidatus Sericytochromatia bacterium]